MDDAGSKLTIVLTLVGIVVALAVGTGGLNVWMLSTMFSLQGSLSENQHAVRQQAMDIEEIKRQISSLNAALGDAPGQIQAAARAIEATLSVWKSLPR